MSITAYSLRGFRRFLPSLIFLVFSFHTHANLPGIDALQPSIGAVTSFRGTIRHEQDLPNSKGRSPSVHLRSVLPMNRSFFGTEEDGYLFLSLSNGIGLGLGEVTDLKIKEYQQAPFDSERESLEYEPSVSALTLSLEKGTLSMAFRHLNPLSTARVELALGTLIVHSGKFVFSVLPDKSCQITNYQGTATFYYADSAEREFVASGKSLIITPESANSFSIKSIAKMDDLPEHWEKMVSASDLSRKRVLFRQSSEGNQPQPVWIIPSSDANKPATRPFQYNIK